VLKGWNRLETWLTLGVAGIALVLFGVGGLWLYMAATPPIHRSGESVPSAAGPAASKDWATATDRARQTAREMVAEQNLPGASVAVGIGGALVWSEGFGFADLNARTPVTSDTRFRIGTASIPLTSAAVGLLFERKRLQLDEAIQTHVNEFPQKPWPVTLRQIMGHTSGLTSDGGDEGPLFGQHCERPADALPLFANADLRFEPGTQYRYSRFGWIVVSAAVEAAAGDHFLRFMQQEVFDPLGMHDTLADSNTEQIEHRATSYFPRFAGDPRYGPDPMREVDYSCYAGSSAFISTATDLVRFAMALKSGTLLRPATVALLQAEQRLASGEGTGYGLGWDIETVTLGGKPTQSIGHDGDLLGGVAVTLMTLPEHNLAVAVLSNISYADTPAIALRIAEAFAQGK